MVKIERVPKPDKKEDLPAIENALRKITGGGWTEFWRVYETSRSIVAETEYIHKNTYRYRTIDVRLRFTKGKPLDRVRIEFPGANNYIFYQGLREPITREIMAAVK